MDETRRYHEHFYERNEAFEQGSWLEKPEAAVLEQLDNLQHKKQLRILDLCCGVGRNAIPLALALKGSGSRIECVDSLESAIDKITENARKHGVEDTIHPVCKNVHAYHIEKGAYDFIISWSCLEHLKKLGDFNEMLPRIKKGTAAGGINCFLINAEVTEFDAEDNMERKALIELNFRQDKLMEILVENYGKWGLLKMEREHYINHLDRYGRKVVFKSHPLIFCAQNVSKPHTPV